MSQRLIEQSDDDMADDTMGWVIEALRAEFENCHVILKQRMQLLEQKVERLSALIVRQS